MNDREKLVVVFEGNKDKVIDYLLIENSRLENTIRTYSNTKIDRLNSMITDYKKQLKSCDDEIERLYEERTEYRFNQAKAVMYLENKIKRQKEALRKLQTVIERDKDTQEELYAWAKEHGYFEEEEDEQQ